jgi:hypothetical protein
MNRFREARDRGAAYLLSTQLPDGSVPDAHLGAGQYWGTPIALQVAGHSQAAGRLLDWIRNNAFTAEGDFGPSPERDQDHYYAYFNSWLIEAAHRMGQFDLSQRGTDFMLRFWDSDSGGFYSSPTERSAETRQDLWVVAGCGRAAVYTGRLDVARATGRWMRMIIEAQPNYPAQMFPVYSRARGLHTDVELNDEFRYVLNQDANRDESFYHPGIAGGFLARLYQATGEAEWLELAIEYMRFAEGASDYLFRILRAGKVGWAASVLYTITGESKYREMAIRVGDNLIALQSPEGNWSDALQITDTPSSTLTAEMVIWLDEIHQAVGQETGASQTGYPATAMTSTAE